MAPHFMRGPALYVAFSIKKHGFLPGSAALGGLPDALAPVPGAPGAPFPAMLGGQAAVAQTQGQEGPQESHRLSLLHFEN